MIKLKSAIDYEFGSDFSLWSGVFFQGDALEHVISVIQKEDPHISLVAGNVPIVYSDDELAGTGLYLQPLYKYVPDGVHTVQVYQRNFILFIETDHEKGIRKGVVYSKRDIKKDFKKCALVS